MSLRALRTLHAIARHGSFARAGEVVGLTQSAVSLQVKALENEFGAPLFDRSKRLPELTPAGRIVLEKSAEVLALYDEIPAALGDERSLAGRLRLGAIQTSLSGVLPDALAALNRSHPRVRVHVSAGMSAELALQVAAGELDAAVVTEPVQPHPRGLVWTPLYQDRFWLVAPDGRRDRTPCGLLREHPFIRFDSKAWAGRVIDRELRRMRLEVREEMVLDSQEVILRMVEKGLGIAVIPMADDVRARLRLTCLPFGEPQLIRQVVLLERQDRRGGRLATTLAEAVTAAARASAADGSLTGKPDGGRSTTSGSH
ncbi:LysR family transcriptional regulator [Methylorubrum populi]|jgi:DNA-binding transcriptional LysR family regulator|uniref:Transcriptional regulator LysR family n=1 Tax=Methylorubrum populi TaxID=223967 RepID=A0A833J8S1_9HYPH|nr:LysR family transcriptional regulator [Methylorubrum populi]KAB7786409.1 Transcriptional regulator LysR family [Methylorubrum populi]